MQVALIGEGMLELSRGAGGWRLGYGGDTLNTAIHLARFGHDVAYLSALGADPFSADLRSAWAAEGVDVSHVLTDPTRTAGLYAIRTDDAGERSFTYWRSDSAARAMFTLPGVEAALAAAEQTDLLCFSLISLAILPEDARDRLAELCMAVRRRGGNVVFDSNYRPLLWRDVNEARATAERFISLSDVGLPTLSDEAMLWGAPYADAVAERWHGLGVQRVIVKLGPEGCLFSEAREHRIVSAEQTASAIDTSGAGDAFNAGFVHGTLAGQPPEQACRTGHRLAAWVIGRSGAIPPRDAAAPY